jgi:hypothetical protein
MSIFMDEKNYNAQDDVDLAQFIMRGEMPLFSLQMRFIGKVRGIGIAEENYSNPYNIVGGPKRMTVEYMVEEGFNEINRLQKEGLVPDEVIVTHDFKGDMQVKPLYKK